MKTEQEIREEIKKTVDYGMITYSEFIKHDLDVKVKWLRWVLE